MIRLVFNVNSIVISLKIQIILNDLSDIHISEAINHFSPVLVITDFKFNWNVDARAHAVRRRIMMNYR